MAAGISALRAEQTIRDPFFVHRLLNSCTFELGRLTERIKKVHAKLSVKSIVVDYRLLNLVSNTLVDLLYLKTNQLIVDQNLEGIASDQRTQAVEMLLNGRATVAKLYDPMLDGIMHKLEETQIVQRILEELKTKKLRKCKENYEKLHGRYMECIELHQKTIVVRERFIVGELFDGLRRELGLPFSSATDCMKDQLLQDAPSESSLEEEEEDHATMIESFMEQSQEARKTQFEDLSPTEKDSICEVVAKLYDKWVSCNETEEELDYEWAIEFLCGPAKEES